MLSQVAVGIKPTIRQGRRAPSHGLRRARPFTTVVPSALSLAAVPQEALYLGGALLAGVGLLVGYQLKQNKLNGAGAAEQAQAAAPEPEMAARPLPRENAVLVMGATGRLGRRVVQQVRKSPHARRSRPVISIACRQQRAHCGSAIAAHAWPASQPACRRRSSWRRAAPWSPACAAAARRRPSTARWASARATRRPVAASCLCSRAWM
jgi:hypothetical protein